MTFNDTLFQQLNLAGFHVIKYQYFCLLIKTENKSSVRMTRDFLHFSLWIVSLKALPAELIIDLKVVCTAKVINFFLWE